MKRAYDQTLLLNLSFGVSSLHIFDHAFLSDDRKPIDHVLIESRVVLIASGMTKNRLQSN